MPLRTGARWQFHSNGRSAWWLNTAGVESADAVVISVRLSKDREGAKLGPRTQLSDCRKLAKAQGKTVVGEFVDDDIPITETGGKTPKERPGFTRTLEVLDKGQAGTLLAWHTDRLYRGFAELDRLVRVCERQEPSVLTVQSGELDLSTASGRMIARMLAVVGMAEVERLTERVKAQKAQAAADGMFHGGRRPFGFEADGVTHRAVEAEAIERDSGRVLAGVSIRQIAREWNEQELTTSTGKAWRALDVRKTLLRPRNAGYRVHQGRIVGDAEWAPIVDRDTWTALRALLTAPDRGGQSFERKYQGSGVYLCGKCGNGARVTSGTRTDGTPGYKCGTHLSRHVRHVDELVSAAVVGRLSMPDAAITFGNESGVDVAGLHTRRAALQAKLDELGELFAAGDIDGSQLKAGTVRLRADVAVVDAELAEARAESVLANVPLGSDELAEAWEGLSPDLRGKIVDAVMAVTVHGGRGRKFKPETVVMDWRESGL